MAADDSFPIARLLPSLASLDQSKIDLITSLFEPVSLKKDQIFIQKGEKVTKVAYVVKGTLTRFNDHEKGHMIIDQFLVPNQFFSDRIGYFSQGSSATTIQANSACLLWTLSLNAIKELSNTIPEFSEIINSIIKETLNHDLDLKELFSIKDPLQRILRFYELYPHSWSDIPKKYLPCYLQMSKGLFYQCQKK